MDDRSPAVRRSALRLSVGPVGALCLAVAMLAVPEERTPETSEAVKVASKVDKALATAHQAEAERKAFRHFEDDVADYAELHAKQLSKLGSRGAAAEQEAAGPQKALAHAIAAKRAKAEPGDVFRPEVEPLFRRLIAEQLEGPDALAARKAVREGNPGQDEDSVPIVVRVNAEYPLGAPRSTVPPSVLLTLPPLPPCLHYRFVGRDLVLVDSVAQLVVDFLPAAAPELGSK